MKGAESVVTEEYFVEKMVKRLQGRSGLASLASNIEQETYQTAPWFKKVS